MKSHSGSTPINPHKLEENDIHLFLVVSTHVGTCSKKQSPELPDIVLMDHHLNDSSIRQVVQ